MCNSDAIIHRVFYRNFRVICVTDFEAHRLCCCHLVLGRQLILPLYLGQVPSFFTVRPQGKSWPHTGPHSGIPDPPKGSFPRSSPGRRMLRKPELQRTTGLGFVTIFSWLHQQSQGAGRAGAGTFTENVVWNKRNKTGAGRCSQRWAHDTAQLGTHLTGFFILFDCRPVTKKGLTDFFFLLPHFFKETWRSLFNTCFTTENILFSDYWVWQLFYNPVAPKCISLPSGEWQCWLTRGPRREQEEIWSIFFFLHG